MATYTGFSTYNRQRKFKLIDFELVRQDLFNHFHIRKGEKLMNSNFGTIIWDLLFEPFTDSIKNIITDEIKKIVQYDPRVIVDNVNVTELDFGIQLEIELRYALSNQSARMKFQFDRDSGQLTVSA
jgi:phage baseplate assembly protein W